jgi:hypothetical protein
MSAEQPEVTEWPEIIIGQPARGKTSMAAMHAAELMAMDMQHVQHLISDLSAAVAEAGSIPWWGFRRSARVYSRILSLHEEITALQQEMWRLAVQQDQAWAAG